MRCPELVEGSNEQFANSLIRLFGYSYSLPTVLSGLVSQHLSGKMQLAMRCPELVEGSKEQ